MVWWSKAKNMTINTKNVMVCEKQTIDSDLSNVIHW
jgi:hypothetical protein